MGKKKHKNFWFDDEMEKHLKELARANRVSETEIVRRALKQLYDNQFNQPKEIPKKEVKKENPFISFLKGYFFR